MGLATAGLAQVVAPEHTCCCHCWHVTLRSRWQRMPDQATFAQQKGHFTRRTRSNSSPGAGFRLVTVNAGRHQRVATKRARCQHGLARLRHVCF